MISISELHASYEGAEIIHGISADFPEGKITVLMGPNGCGKSTTLRSLLRMVPETSGSMTLNGQELEALAPQALARRIAYLPQSRNVPDITVERLVIHGRFPYLSYPRRYRREDWEKVTQALEWVGLTELRKRKMENLSGGQRQKAYLAMALAQDTEVILMDEPTTFLDIRNQFEMLDRSRALADGGKTVVMILHDFEAILRYADHVILMKDGQILTAGSAEQVLRSEEVRQAFGVKPCFFESEDGLHCYVRPEQAP
ncbi:MAG: ABC transporter ATP-binding protein [Oscillospiraceae bacterium]|nr:ABC transporter ATP-binding protein [Oscillospiraceae bacterium]